MDYLKTYNNNTIPNVTSQMGFGEGRTYADLIHALCKVDRLFPKYFQNRFKKI